MKWMQALGAGLGAFLLLTAQEDPVLAARAQRAQAQGIAEGDLPPVPKAILEPPPLPPPELHTRDLRKGRKGSVTKVAARKGKGKGAVKAVKTKPSKPTAKKSGRKKR